MEAYKDAGAKSAKYDDIQMSVTNMYKCIPSECTRKRCLIDTKKSPATPSNVPVTEGVQIHQKKRRKKDENQSPNTSITLAD